MSTSLTQDTMTEAYTDLEHLIPQTVNRFLRQYGTIYGSHDDLCSEAREFFVVACHTYKPGRTTFERWVSYRIFCGLTEGFRKQVFRHNRLRRAPVDVNTTPSRVPFLHDFLEGLSEDAQTVVKLALDPPPDVKLATRQRGKDNPTNLLLAVREFLKDFQWPEDHITRTIKEVKEALKKV